MKHVRQGPVLLTGQRQGPASRSCWQRCRGVPAAHGAQVARRGPRADISLASFRQPWGGGEEKTRRERRVVATGGARGGARGAPPASRPSSTGVGRSRKRRSRRSGEPSPPSVLISAARRWRIVSDKIPASGRRPSNRTCARDHDETRVSELSIPRRRPGSSTRSVEADLFGI